MSNSIDYYEGKLQCLNDIWNEPMKLETRRELGPLINQKTKEYTSKIEEIIELYKKDKQKKCG